MYQDSQGRKWWKGNLHTHTTLSDGRKTPAEAAARYREEGYDFLALTDHWHFAPGGEAEGLLLLSGCEYDVGEAGLAENGIYHIVAIGAEQAPALAKAPGLTAQQVLDAVHAAGGFAILAHPAWSLNRPDEIVRLRGIDASEVYNTMSGTPWNGRRADSGVILDTAAANGLLLPLVASDDAHSYTGEDCRSFVYVQADELSRGAILSALRAGRFYASQGPRMEISFDGERVRVSCTPAQMVVFYSNLVWSSNRVVQGEGLTAAEYRVLPGERFVRAEVIDAEGRIAWSSPFAVQGA